MLTKGAIGNLINRYRAVLRKCHLLNTFGSLAVASMLVLGGAGVAGATVTPIPIEADGYGINTEDSQYNDVESVLKKGSGKDSGEILAYELGGDSAKGTRAWSKDLTITDYDTLIFTGSNNKKQNVILNNEAVTTINNIKNFNIGTETEKVNTLTGIHNYSGTVDIDVDNVYITTTGSGVQGQKLSASPNIIKIKASESININSEGAALYLQTNSKTPENKSDHYVDTTLSAKKIKLYCSGDYAVAAFNREYVYDSNPQNPQVPCGGSVAVSINGTESVNIEAAGTYGLYAVNFAGGDTNISASINSSEGDVSITSGSYGVYAYGSDVDITGTNVEINAATKGVYAYGSDVDITGTNVEINAATKGVDAYASDINLLGNVAVASKGVNAGQAINLQSGSAATIGGEGKTVTLSAKQEAGNGSGVIRALTIGASSATIEGDVSISSNVANAGQWSIGVDVRDFDKYNNENSFTGDASLTFSGSKTQISASGDTSKNYNASGVQAVVYNGKRSEITFSANETLIDVTSRRDGFVNGVIAEGQGASVLFNGETASISIENLGYTAQGVNGYGGGIVTFDGTKATVNVQSDVGATGILGSFESGTSSPYGLIQLKNGAEVTVNTYITGDGIAGAGKEYGRNSVGSMEDISVAEGSTLNVNVHGAGLWDNDGDVNNTVGTAGIFTSEDTTIDGTVNISVVAGQNYTDMKGNEVIFSTDEIGKYDAYGVSYSDAHGILIYGSNLKAGDASQINISVSEGYSNAYGIKVQDGFSLGIDYPVEKVNLLNAVNIEKVEGKTGAFGIALEDKAALTIAGKTSISSVTSSDGDAHGLRLTDTTSASFGDLEIASVSGKTGSYGISLDGAGTSLALNGTTTINATATKPANAHAISGAGSVTNSGSLTVESGSLSGFTGTYTQTAGSTDITKASDFFGGPVNINAGSLTVDAKKLDADYAKDVLGATFGGNLVVDFANLDDKSYTFKQYEAAQNALLGDGDTGKLVFINASLEELEDGASLVVGAKGGDGEYTLAGNPTIIEGNETPATSTESIPTIPTETVQLVDNATGDLLSPDTLKIDGQQLAVKSIQVADGSANVDLVIGAGSDMTFTGAPMIDESGNAVVTNPHVKEGGVANLGMAGVESEDKQRVFGDTVIEGEMNLFNQSATNNSLTITETGSLFLDPTYKYTGELNLDGKAVVSEGSVLQVGGTAEDLDKYLSDAGFAHTAVDGGFVVDSGNAVLALDTSIELANTSILVVDPNAAKSDVFERNSTIFADDSLLIVTPNAATASTAAIVGASGSLTVEPNAALYVADAVAGETYTIASNFGTITDGSGAAVTELEGWNGDKLIVNRLLTAETTVDSGSVIVTTEAKSVEEALPGAIPVNALAEMAENGMGDGSNAGQTFLGKAIDPTVMPDTAKAVDTINEVSRAAVTAGVQNTALRIADAASNTVLGHLSLSQHDGSKSIHADGADFWAAPMYGNLYTSGMVTDGASVRGQFGGLALGADLEAGQFLGGKFRVGAAINGGGGQSETKGNATSTQNDYDFGGLNFYAGWNNGALNVIGSVGYGFGNHEVEMSAPVLGNAKADVDTTVFTADLRAEYQLKTEWMDLLPHAGVRYTALRTGAHDLKVGGDVLNSVERDTQNIVQFPVGVTLSKDVAFADWNVKPMVDVSVIPAAGDKKANTKVRFSGIDAVDGVNSRIMDSTSWAGTIGVQAEKGDFTLGLNYGVQASSNETDQNVQLKLGWKF